MQGTTTKESYTYDLVGNRLSSLNVSPYNYNSSNELTSTPSGSYTYDANGNTLSDPSGKSYTWDFENRLIQAVVPGTNGGTTTFKYDPFGRRIQKSGPLGTTNYLYDGKSLGSNVIEETDVSGNVLARYSQFPSLDQPLAELRSGVTSYYEQDAIGSVSALTNAAGALANTYTYDSFGKLTASTGAVANPFQYTGRDYDSEDSISYYRARYYDSATGRFLSEDPIRFAGGINFYAYALDNPVNKNDPEGKNPFDHWPLNGNLWPGFRKQDGVCSTGPFANDMNSRPCVLKCCQEHDNCYTAHNCNWSSFLAQFVGMPLSFGGPCQVCNYQVIACLSTADKSRGGGGCKCSQ
jgi:RHS repeat-associated protein